MDPKLTVVHRNVYYTPRQLAQRIRRCPQVCRTQPYLDCVLEYAELTKLTALFAEACQRPELADLGAFEAAVLLEERNTTAAAEEMNTTAAAVASPSAFQTFESDPDDAKS